MASRAKSKVQRPASIKEEVEVSFIEPGKWEASVALLVGETHKAYFFIDQLKKSVNKGTRKLFSFVDAGDIMQAPKLEEKDSASPKKKKEEGRGAKKSATGMEESRPVVTDDSKKSPDLKWQDNLLTLALAVRSKLMELKANEGSRTLAPTKPETEEKPKGRKSQGSAEARKGKASAKTKPETEEQNREEDKEKKDAKDEGHVIKDEPKDGPNRYILLSGFYDPHIVTHLCKVGVPVGAIFKVVIGEKGLCYLDEMSKVKETGSLAKPAVAEVEESANKEIDERLYAFWRDVFLLLDKEPMGSASQDVVNFDLCIDEFLLDGKKDDGIKDEVKRSDDAGAREKIGASCTFGEDALEARRMELFGACLFDRVAQCLYDLVVRKRHWNFYRDALGVTCLPEPLPSDPKVALMTAKELEELTGTPVRPRLIDTSYYRDMMDTLSPDMTSIPLIVYCMKEQVCHWEEELQEAIIPDRGITLADKLGINTGEGEAEFIHNFNNCSSGPGNINNSAAGVVHNLPADPTDLGEGARALALQHIIDHMGKAMLQLALSDKEKEKLKRLFSQPPDPPRKPPPPCCEVPQVVGHHDEVTKRLADPERGQCHPVAFDPLGAELEMLSLTRSADLLRLAESCAGDPELAQTRSAREVRTEELLCYFNAQESSGINATELDHYLSLLILECLNLKTVDLCGVVTEDGSRLIQTVEPIVWDDPYQSGTMFCSIISATNVCKAEAEQVCYALGEKVKCLQKRVLDDFCYVEAMETQSLMQRIHQLMDTHPFMDAYLRRSDGSLLVVLHNPFDASTRTRNRIWRVQVLSNCGLRNFLQFFAERVSGYTDSREAKYQVQKLEAESARMLREMEQAAGIMDVCKMPVVPEEFYVRSGSIKASLMDREKEKKGEEQEDSQGTKEEAKKDKGAEKNKKAEAISKAKNKASEDSGRKSFKSPSGGSHSSSKEIDQLEAREPKIRHFIGYDVGDDVISMVGRSAAMHTMDGGVVEVERIVLGQGRVLSRSTLKKDGHFFNVHLINPTPLAEYADDRSGEGEEKKEAEEKGDRKEEKEEEELERPIRNDATNKRKGDRDAANVNSAKDKSPPKEDKEGAPAEVVPQETKTSKESDPRVSGACCSIDPTGPRLMPVGEFASFSAVLENGLSLSYSIFGKEGQPPSGKPYEPAPYEPPPPPVQVSEDVKETKVDKGKSAKGAKAGKSTTIEPKEETSSSSKDAVEESKPTDEEKKPENDKQAEEEKDPQMVQDFIQLHVCRKDGLQVTFMLESSLGIRPKDLCSRSLMTKMTRKVRGLRMEDGGGDCCRSINFSDERARYVTCDGNVIVVRQDQTFKVLFADGTIKELSWTPPLCLPRAEPLPRPKVEDPKIADKEAAKGHGKKHADVPKKVEVQPEDPPAPPTLYCMTTHPMGERTIQDGSERVVTLKPLRVYKLTDPQTKEVMNTREDNTVSVLKPDGTLVVEHSDCTRITTLQSLPTESSCSSFDKSVSTRFVVECPSYPTVSSDSEAVTVDFDTEHCQVECYPSGAYRLIMGDCSLLCIDETGTATYVQGEVTGSDQVKKTEEEKEECRAKSEPKVSKVAKDVMRFLRFVEGQKVGGIYSMKHGEDVIMETTDSTGRRYVTNKRGEACVFFVEGHEPPIPVTNFMGEDLKIFSVVGSRRGLEFLRQNDAEEEISRLEANPMASVLRGELFDGRPPSKSGALGITTAQTIRREVRSKASMKGCPYAESIVPRGLRSRSFADFPPREEKRPGKPLGLDAGVGLDIKSWGGGCGNEAARKEANALPANDDPCPRPCVPSSEVADECKRAVTVVEKRQFYRFRELDEALRERLNRAMRCFFEARMGEAREAKEMEIEDPRTDEEKEAAEELRRRVAASGLCRVPPPVVTNVASPQQAQEKDTRASKDINQSPIKREPEGDFKFVTNYDASDAKNADGGSCCFISGTLVAGNNGGQTVANLKEGGDEKANDGSCCFVSPSLQAGDSKGKPILNFEIPSNCRDDVEGKNYDDCNDKEGDTQKIDGNDGGFIRPSLVGGDSKGRPVLNFDVPSNCNNRTESENGNVDVQKRGEIISNLNSCNNKMDNNKNECNNNNNNNRTSWACPRHDPPSDQGSKRPTSVHLRSHALALTTRMVNFGPVIDGEIYSYQLQMKNPSLESKRFRVRLPPPSTGLMVVYQAMPVPAGLRCSIEIQLYASLMSSSTIKPTSWPENISCFEQTTRGGHKLRHDLEIATEEGMLKCPIVALILPTNSREGKKGEEEEEAEERSLALMRTPGVKKIKQKLPAGTELFRAWKSMKQAMKSGM